MTANSTKLGDAATARTDQILSAAETLFMTYGMRRTSMDDIAREAGLAKGTVYRSFASKDDLFAALTGRIVDQLEERANVAVERESETLEKLVAYLDETVGAPARLLAATPHTGEILEMKHAVAGRILRRFHAGVQKRVGEICDRADPMPELIIEAAHGCKVSGPLASRAFRARLRRHIGALFG